MRAPCGFSCGIQSGDAFRPIEREPKYLLGRVLITCDKIKCKLSESSVFIEDSPRE